MKCIGWVWLLALEECNIPLILCKEFISSFKFYETTNLTIPSIHFILFGRLHVMSINEWTNRLGICTSEEMETGEASKWDRGVPQDQKDWDKNKAWEWLTGRTEEYNYTNAQAYHLLDPILRICRIIMVSNINGMSTAFSKMPSSSLYFLDRMEKGVKVHLGYWLANILLLSCRMPNRNMTLCHIVGVFVKRNYTLEPNVLSFDTPAPKPYTLDITCLLRAVVIREVGGKYQFYQSGETPKKMKKVGGTSTMGSREFE